VVPGKHSVVAELYWTRLEKLVQLPEQTANFVAKPGKKYFCVFDIDEQKSTWALSIVPDERVSWKTRAFHGARSWRTPKGECIRWDEKLKGCLGDPGTAEPEEDEQPMESGDLPKPEPTKPEPMNPGDSVTAPRVNDR
jgi:hypothetical protein